MREAEPGVQQRGQITMIMKYKLASMKGWSGIWQQGARSQNSGAGSGAGQPAGLEGC